MTAPPKRRQTHTLPLSEFYEHYILGKGENSTRRYKAIILGYHIHSVERNRFWSVLYRVIVFDGREYAKLRCIAEESVTVIFTS